MLLVALLPAAAVPSPFFVTLDLKPVVHDGTVAAVDVAMTLPVGPSAGFELSAPVVYPGAPGVADRMTAIEVGDTKGPVTLVVKDDAAVPGGFFYARRWRAARPVAYPVSVRYRALVQPPGGPGGPPMGLRATGGGIAGALATLLMTPSSSQETPLKVRWDLTSFPQRALASSSSGEDDIVAPEGLARFQQGWFVAGPATRLVVSSTFSASWLGKPTFNAPAAVHAAARGHTYLIRYFPHMKGAETYRIFMQFRERAPFGGGTALDRSFMYTRGPLKPGEKAAPPVGIIFHEMIHQWVGEIDMPRGVESWFSEGLTSYYETRLPLRGGFQTVADYGARINAQTAAYYGNKARNWSADAITKVGFDDEMVRRLPYQRSEFYFHDLDARIRARSHGRRTLDSLMFPMFLAREKGARFDKARWIEMVTGELGVGEAQRFERLILEGVDTLVPRADAFGPCFRRAPQRGMPGAVRWVRVSTVSDAICRRY